MFSSPLVTKTTDDRAVEKLRRHARYLTGNTKWGNEIAAATMRVIPKTPPCLRGKAVDARNTQLLHALHLLHPELRKTPRAREACAQAIVVIEQCDETQIADILALDEGQPDTDKEPDLPTNRSVFLIEDEALLAMDVCQAITECGNKISGIARTSAEAVQRLARSKPDLIVSDVALADGSSGVEAITKIAARHENLPVVFLTGNPEVVSTASNHDPAYVLEKPHDPARLHLMMALALRAPEDLPVRPRTRKKPDQETDDRQDHND